MPKKFCSVRWLNNADVAERVVKLFPNLKKYVEGNERERKKVNSESYKTVVQGLQDKLMGAKLSFFSHVANIIEPFLTEYQCNAPMAPFLNTDLTLIMKELLTIIVKAEVLEDARSVDKIQLNDSTLVLPRCEAWLWCKG